MMQGPAPRHPVDGGWAWMVCLGAGVQFYFVIGGLKSLGVLFVILVDLFDADPALTGVVIALIAALFAIVSVLANALGNMFSYRKVILFGGLLYSASAFFSAFAPNIYFVIVVLGIPTGFAYGFMSAPGVYMVAVYFNKRKSLASGLSLVGSSIGQLSLPYLTMYLMDAYGYRGAMLLFAAFGLHSIPAAMLIRPTAFYDQRKPREVAGHEDRELVGEVAPVVMSPSSDGTPAGGGLHTAADARTHSSLHDLHHRSATSLHKSVTSLHKSMMSIHSHTDSVLMDAGSLHFGPSLVDLDKIEPVLDGEADTAGPPPAPEGPPPDPCANGCCACLANFARKVFDRELLSSNTFRVFLVGVGFGHAGFIVACLFLPALSYELFDDKFTGPLLLMIMGGSDIIGRVGGGLIADTGVFRRSNFVGFSLLCTGAATFIAPFWPTYTMMIVYSVIMGAIGGIYRSLLPVIVVDYFGRGKLSPGTALTFASMGVLSFPMPVLSGAMKTALGSYRPVFKLYGVLILIAAALFFIMPLIERAEARVARRKAEACASPEAPPSEHAANTA